jgi:hypothetical protein
MCDTCLKRVREAHLTTAWVYPSGHILCTVERLPSLADWPAIDDLSTFCGLPITGKESSRLYRL